MDEQVYFLRAKDDIIRAKIIRETKTKYELSYDNGNIHKSISKASVYPTREQAEKANEHFTKQQGKTEVYPFWNLEDILKMSQGFKKKGLDHWEVAMWIGLMLGRRVGDIMDMKWSDFFYENWECKQYLEVLEEKTGKYKRMVVPPFLDKILIDYHSKKFSKDDSVNLQIFPSNSSRKDAAYRKAFTTVAKEVGIEYPVSTHSVRKSFGLWSRRLHPQDANSLQVLQRFFNHSDADTTMRYIGLDELAELRYISDMADLMEQVWNGDTEFIERNDPVVSIKTADIREIIKTAFSKGKECRDIPANDQLNILNCFYDQLERCSVK